MSEESLQEVLKRVCSVQPQIHLMNHEGYYRHSDVNRLILEIGRIDTEKTLKHAYYLILLRWVDAQKKGDRRRAARLYSSLDAMRGEWPDISFEPSEEEA